MNLKEINPKKALNKAFLKIKPIRSEIEKFKMNLIQLIDHTNDKESEEFHKNLVSDFLKNTYYSPNHFINTKNRNDLVIHNGNDAKSTVGVIIEAKSTTNKAEMLSVSKLNSKAFQELVLYYLRERIKHHNLEVKHVVATNIYEWFVFDANLFEKLFAQNKSFVKQFTDFEEGRLAGKTTDFFYKQIAEPYIEEIKQSIEFTHFDIRDYEKPLRNEDAKDDNKLIALYKLLSPEHLLKLPFTNDSNSLDKRFYGELLHIIGLIETKEGGKKLIQRNKSGERQSGTILENAIIQLDSADKINRLEKPSLFGDTNEERLFNAAMELTITWINRILFLKLLEAQLISYHKGDKSYAFLSIDKINDYDDLNSLFFQVLARKHDERIDDVKQAFAKVPYLNSSLFEPTDLEQNTLFISNLKDNKPIPVYSGTVLKDTTGKKKSGELNTLAYFFEFLNAYDFTSEGTEEIQEDNKTLINASVLGLIFEKINGYKDGSFFTPGFITMYMCRETIRRSVVQKFNEAKSWNCSEFDDLYDKIEDKKEANEIVNSLKICDPAVGSGHFLVSALNEIISIKNDLKILQDRDGKRLKEYQVEVVNDELIVTDEDGDLFEYIPTSKESQRVQVTLFHEKQTIIENCLFGVDINPNSVKICRLRLWIELLKSAYYKNETELETLPNIDINIKCGNSLISRFALDSDLSAALKKSKWNIDSYKLAVDTYRNATSKDQKREMERLINDIKNDFRTEIGQNSKEQKDLIKFSEELYQKYVAPKLFEDNLTPAQKKKQDKERKDLEEKVAKLKNIIEEVKSNKIYENAFEWRFEFPDVLNNEGEFVGFDTIVGNPPYFSISSEPSLNLIESKYQTFSSSGDIYSLFIELSSNIIRPFGLSTLIISNKWMRANYGESLRKFIIDKTNPIEIIDFGQNLIFENAVVHTNILTFEKNNNLKILKGIRFQNDFFNKNNIEFKDYIRQNTIKNIEVNSSIWNINDNSFQKIKNKSELNGKKLINWNIEINFGIKTGYNEAFIINEEIKNKLIKEDENVHSIIKPILRGRDTRKYFANFANLYLINSHNGYESNKRIDIINDYPVIYKYLQNFLPKVEKRSDQGKHWTNLRNCAYIEKFSSPKIIFSEIVSQPQFYFDELGYYPEATVFFISGEKLKFLTALLNSKAVTFLYKSFYMGGELVGKIRYKKSFLENVPIPIPDNNQEEKISTLVDQIIYLKNENLDADTSALENKIDQLVYQLYELTDEEIKIVEESVK